VVTAHRVSRLVLAPALFAGAIQVATGWVEPYGLLHDELYYWVGAKRLSLGYVDHPPLAPWVLAGWTALLGDGRLAFVLVPALCSAGTVLLTGWMAGRFGAGRFGQGLASLCVALLPFNLVLFSFYSVNALEVLLWTAFTALLVELLRTGNERLWLGLGVIGGLGLLDKHTFALLLAGTAVGIVGTPLRAQLRSRWPWLGGAAALLVTLPNLVWNARHGWPSLAFYRSRPLVDLPATWLDALELQVMGTNQASVLVWAPGVLFLLFSRRARAHRALAIVFVTLFAVILLSGQRRADRIAGIYPVVLAAGAACWNQWTGRGHRAARTGLVALLLLFGALTIPAALPLLPPAAAGEYFDALGGQPEIERADVGPSIPLYLTGRLEWERLGDEVARAWDALPPREQARAVVLAPHWVFASVVQYYGRNRDLGPVVSPHNAYWFWRSDAAGRDVVLSVAVPEEVLSRYFAETREVAVFRCEYCTSFRPDLTLLVGKGPVRPVEELLTGWRHFGILPSPHLRP
jgi:4-amino-4-deoxy-L-arabinose transferase-like glycosyltransferase